jgi:hypothetical protein
MAATAWQLYNYAKRYIGNGTIRLGTGVFKMVLARTSSNAATLTISTYGQLTAEISATGGYVAGGRNLVPATAQWTVGASASQMKFTMSTVGLTFTASGAPLTNIRYAILRNSGSTAALSKLLCYCALSSTQFTVTSPNTLTILPAATGIFTLT